MRSAFPPERLEVELQSRLGPSLSHRGYRLMGQGVAGLTWRRELSSAAIAGMVLLGLIALGGIASGDLAGVVVGVAALVGLFVAWYSRGPSTLSISFTRFASGTELAVSGGRDAAAAEELLRRIIGPEQTVREPTTREARSEKLWSS